jgi:hypothetical protein
MPRVCIDFTEDAYEVVREMADSYGQSVSDFVRDAVAFEKWYEDTRATGGHLIVERGDTRGEVIRPRRDALTGRRFKEGLGSERRE